MLSYGYTTEHEETGIPYIENTSVTYCQGPDNCQNKDECQYLKLETSDGGGGPYIRMSIPSTGMLNGREGFWSVADITDLFAIFEDFKEKVNYTPEEYEKKNYREYYQAPPLHLVEEILYKYVNDYGKENVKKGAEYIVEHWKDKAE